MTTYLLFALCGLFTVTAAVDTNRTGRASNRFTQTGVSANSCTTSAGLLGTCMTRFNCLKSGGLVSGFCSTYGVCCETNMQCGERSTLKRTIIQTPSNLLTRCTYIIEPYSNRVCQVKIEMNDFRLQQPVLSADNTLTCVDYLEVNGQKICGNNDGQHIYVPFDVYGGTESNLNLQFYLPTLGATKQWYLVVTQLECPTVSQRKGFLPFAKNAGFQDIKSIFQAQNTDLANIAPVGCTQYFTERTGTFESFNFNGGAGPYPANLNYAICFQRRVGDSFIEFTFTDFVLPNNNTNGGLDADCYSLIVTVGKEEDYLMIPGAIFKGNNVQPTYFCGQSSQGKIITDAAPGPFVIYFNSDGVYTPDNKGFRISYGIL